MSKKKTTIAAALKSLASTDSSAYEHIMDIIIGITLPNIDVTRSLHNLFSTTDSPIKELILSYGDLGNLRDNIHVICKEIIAPEYIKHIFPKQTNPYYIEKFIHHSGKLLALIRSIDANTSVNLPLLYQMEYRLFQIGESAVKLKDLDKERAFEQKLNAFIKAINFAKELHFWTKKNISHFLSNYGIDLNASSETIKESLRNSPKRLTDSDHITSCLSVITGSTKLKEGATKLIVEFYNQNHNQNPANSLRLLEDYRNRIKTIFQPYNVISKAKVINLTYAEVILQISRELSSHFVQITETLDQNLTTAQRCDAVFTAMSQMQICELTLTNPNPHVIGEDKFTELIACLTNEFGSVRDMDDQAPAAQLMVVTRIGNIIQDIIDNHLPQMARDMPLHISRSIYAARRVRNDIAHNDDSAHVKELVKEHLLPIYGSVALFYKYLIWQKKLVQEPDNTRLLYELYQQVIMLRLYNKATQYAKKIQELIGDDQLTEQNVEALARTNSYLFGLHTKKNQLYEADQLAMKGYQIAIQVGINRWQGDAEFNKTIALLYRNYGDIMEPNNITRCIAAYNLSLKVFPLHTARLKLFKLAYLNNTSVDYSVEKFINALMSLIATSQEKCSAQIVLGNIKSMERASTHLSNIVNTYHVLCSEITERKIKPRYTVAVDYYHFIEQHKEGLTAVLPNKLISYKLDAANFYLDYLLEINNLPEIRRVASEAIDIMKRDPSTYPNSFGLISAKLLSACTKNNTTDLPEILATTKEYFLVIQSAALPATTDILAKEIAATELSISSAVRVSPVISRIIDNGPSMSGFTAGLKKGFLNHGRGF